MQRIIYHNFAKYKPNSPLRRLNRGTPLRHRCGAAPPVSRQLMPRPDQTRRKLELLLLV